jgi:hypothetical protein
MKKPKARTQPKPRTLVSPKNSHAQAAAMPLQDIVRERAYELYESRGREPGLDEQDWLRAEEEILRHQG